MKEMKERKAQGWSWHVGEGVSRGPLSSRGGSSQRPGRRMESGKQHANGSDSR